MIKKCNYCSNEDDKLDLFNKEYYVFDDNFRVNGQVSKDRIEVSLSWHDFFSAINAKIKYCPMCGRKLKDE